MAKVYEGEDWVIFIVIIEVSAVLISYGYWREQLYYVWLLKADSDFSCTYFSTSSVDHTVKAMGACDCRGLF